jgi:hypothetical protein
MTTDTPPDDAAPDRKARFRNLRTWNLSMGALHAIQAVFILVLANDFALPVTATFMTDAPGVNPPEL